MDSVKKLIRQATSVLSSGKQKPDFFELVRRLELHMQEKPRIGHAAMLEEDILRFGQIPHLSFTSGTVADIRENTLGTILLQVAPFGMLGPNGPMPLEFTSFVLQRSMNHSDRTWQRFLDLFNHRFLTLYYRAWAQNEAIVSADRMQDDPIRDIVQGFTGVPKIMNDGEWKKYTDAMNSAARFFSSGRRSRHGLSQMLAHYFSVPVQIENKVPGAFDIPKECRFTLGNRETAVLGSNMQVGKKFLCASWKVNIHVGPISFQQYQDLLPGTTGFRHFSTLASTYLDHPVHHDMVFRIKSDTIPEIRLNKGMSIGRSFWLGKVSGQQTTVRIGSYRKFAKEHFDSQNSTENN